MAAIASTTTDSTATTSTASSVATTSTSANVVSTTTTSSVVSSSTSSTDTSLTTTSLSSSSLSSTSSTASSTSTLSTSLSAGSTVASTSSVSSSVSSSSLTLSSSSSTASPTTTSSTSSSASLYSVSSSGYSSSLTSSSSSAASASASSASSSDLTPLVRSLIIAATVVGSFIALVLALGFVLRRQRHRRKTSRTLEMDDNLGRKSRDMYETEDEREKYGAARGGSGYATDEGVFIQAMGRHHRPSSRYGGRSVEDPRENGYPLQEDPAHGMYYGGSEVSLFQPPMGVEQGRAWGDRPFTPVSTFDYQSGGLYNSSSDLHRAPSPQSYAFNQHQAADPNHPYYSPTPQSYTAYQAPNNTTTTPSVIVTAPYEKPSDTQTSNVDLKYPQGSEAPAYQESVNRMDSPEDKTQLSTRSEQMGDDEETSALQPGGAYSAKGIKMRVVRGFTASLEDELHVVPFTDLTLHQTYDDGWCLASTATGKLGMVPRDCLSLPDVLHGSTTRRTVSPTLQTAATFAPDEPSASRALPQAPVGESPAWLSKKEKENASPKVPQLADLGFTGQFTLSDVGVSRDSAISDDVAASSPLSFSERVARRSSLKDSSLTRTKNE